MLDQARAEPRPHPSLPPADVTEAAERCLRSNPYLALKNVTCAYRDGVLLLQGCLSSYYLKQVAQQVVARVEGVRRIDNQIMVVAALDRPNPG